ncbi:nuclear transport factor 2 family protein [Halomonas sp. MCCC 1A11062]|jgi:ketosteroid isomerase-like protein|nr:nuclear transport factor 2 family protein [Halomonas sp. MCCC 1A11062]
MKIGATIALILLNPLSHAKDQHDSKPHEAANEAIIRQAFENWQQGRGNFFDLLSEDAKWTIVGSSPISGTYRSRQELIEHSVIPINDRLSSSITPHVRHIIAEGSIVVVFWDGSATTLDGNRYDNNYAWHMIMEDGEIKEVTAFLDTWQLTKLLE